MEAGEAKLGFVTIGVALQAWNGTGVWAGKKPARSKLMPSTMDPS